MKTIILSAHAQTRINTRLGGLTSIGAVIAKVEKLSDRLTKNRHWVLISKIAYTEIADSSVKPDGIARGDQLVALVENFTIETVLLRKSWSNSAEYKKIIQK
jgi:hypothetical protein